MKYENGGLKNLLAPRNHSPMFNKVLLCINAALFVCCLVTSFIYLNYQEYELSLCMLLVALITAGNAFAAWKRLRRTRKERQNKLSDVL